MAWPLYSCRLYGVRCTVVRCTLYALRVRCTLQYAAVRVRCTRTRTLYAVRVCCTLQYTAVRTRTLYSVLQRTAYAFSVRVLPYSVQRTPYSLQLYRGLALIWS
jgi:hypothetical protein